MEEMKYSLSFIKLTLMLLVSGLVGEVSSCCPCSWSYHNGSCYQLFTDELVYTDSMAACENLGGSLASMKTQSVDGVLQALMSVTGVNKAYIGVNHYELSDGTLVAFWLYDNSSVFDGYNPMKRQDMGDKNCGFHLKSNSKVMCVNENNEPYFCQVDSECTNVTLADDLECFNDSSTSTTMTSTITSTTTSTTSTVESSTTSTTSTVEPSTATITLHLTTTATLVATTVNGELGDAGKREGALSENEKVTTSVGSIVGVLLIIAVGSLAYLIYKRMKRSPAEELQDDKPEYEEQQKTEQQNQANHGRFSDFHAPSHVMWPPHQSSQIMNSSLPHDQAYCESLVNAQMQGMRNVSIHSLGESEAQIVSLTTVTCDIIPQQNATSLFSFLSAQTVTTTLGAGHTRVRLLPKPTAAMAKFQSSVGKVNKLSVAANAFEAPK